MRDSQSLLEQLLAFAPGRITVADVHEMLGTAGEDRLIALLGHLVDRHPAAALAELDAAATAGVDPGLLIEQLFGCLRDAMVVDRRLLGRRRYSTRRRRPPRAWPKSAGGWGWRRCWR